MNAANFCNGQKHQFRFFLLEEVLCGGRIFQIQLGMGARHQVGVALPLQFAHDRTARQAAMTGDVDLRIVIHGNEVQDSKEAGKVLLSP